MDLTESGITIVSSDKQPEKDNIPILVNLCGLLNITFVAI